ncbi:MAG: hypothetical protein R3C97_08175 [Geminicoccaceae bacterium]
MGLSQQFVDAALRKADGSGGIEDGVPGVVRQRNAVRRAFRLSSLRSCRPGIMTGSPSVTGRLARIQST